MIEAYAVVTLLGLGYIMNQHKTQTTRSTDPAAVDAADLPSGDMYSSTRLQQVQQAEREAAQRSYQASVSADPIQARTINRKHGLFVKSALTGTDIPKEQFTHNNMVPFFRGSGPKQDMRLDGTSRTSALLESYGAGGSAPEPKQERAPAFLPQIGVTNIGGLKSTTDFLESRYEPGRLRNNTLPFEQVRVGPGLGLGYTATPAGGFQQDNIDDLIRPKTVDELRVASNPKVTYEGRVVEGQKSVQRGQLGKVEKNRVETFFEQGEERLLKTTGAYLKEQMFPEYDAKDTARQDTSTEYHGGAFVNSGHETRDARVQQPHRSVLDAFGVTAPSFVNKYVNDYGKANILVYANERDTTTTCTYQGNVTTVIKALVAPILDALKPNRKEYNVEHARQYGAMSVQIPSKITVRDPNDVLRTTIKETTIHDTTGAANLKGHTKITVHDPNDVARTTLKETTIHDTTDGANMARVEQRGVVYDPDEVARTTIRQTTCAMDAVRNLDGSKRPTAKPDDRARTTVKQTTHASREGNVDGLAQRNQAYLNERYEMKPTQMEEYVDYEHVGAAKVGQGGEGYTVANVEAKDTQKQDLHDEYFGGGVDTTAKQTMSYDDIYNARFDDMKESVSAASRAPTTTSRKVTAGVESVNVHVGRLEQENGRTFTSAPAPPIAQAPDTCISGIANVTRTRNAYEDLAADRMDPALLKAFRENPYTQSLTSAV